MTTSEPLRNKSAALTPPAIPEQFKAPLRRKIEAQARREERESQWKESRGEEILEARANSSDSKKITSAPGRMNPEKIDRLIELHLTGRTQVYIAKELGVSPSTISHHIHHTLPGWFRQAAGQSVEKELARIDRMTLEAWGYFRAACEPLVKEVVKTRTSGEEEVVRTTTHRGPSGEWYKIILSTLDMKLKLLGYYAPEQGLDSDDAVRVAGVDPTDLDKRMTARVAEVIKQQRQLKDALCDVQGEGELLAGSIEGEGAPVVARILPEESSTQEGEKI